MTKNEKWDDLIEFAQLDQIVEESYEFPVVIFKHSTSCSISAMAWGRFNRGLESHLDKAGKYYYLDLLRQRDISNTIADKFGVTHQSPQILVILNGKCVSDASHMGVSFSKVLEVSGEN